MILGIFTIRQFGKLIFDMSLDFGPIFVFIFAYQYTKDIFFATTLIMLATVLSILLSYRKEKRLPVFAIFVAIIVLTFGYLTIHLNNPAFIQAKDTIQDIIIATTFLVSYIIKYPIIKKMFGHLLPISQKSYDIMTINWIFHFYFLSLLNEIVRHNFSLDNWVSYKIFSASFTIGHGLFMLFMYRKEIKEGYRTPEFQVKKDF